MTDKDLIAGMWAIVVKHHKANTTPNQMVELLAFVRNHDSDALRERVERAVREAIHLSDIGVVFTPDEIVARVTGKGIKS